MFKNHTRTCPVLFSRRDGAGWALGALLVMGLLLPSCIRPAGDTQGTTDASSADDLAALLALADTSGSSDTSGAASDGSGATSGGDSSATQSPNNPADPVARGDMNGDGVVNAGDIDAFVAAVVGADAFRQAYPNGNRMLADINGDGKVNMFDITPFRHLISGQ